MTDDFVSDSDDGWSQWQAAYDVAPVETTAELARQYAHEAAAQYAADPAAIAAAAAAQVAEVNRIAAESARAEADAQRVRDALVAEYGNDFVAVAPELGQALAADPEFEKLTHSPQQMASYIEQRYLEHKAMNDPDRAEFEKIKAAGPRAYWQGMNYQQALDDVRGRG